MPTVAEILEENVKNSTTASIVLRMDDCKTLEDFEKLKEELKSKVIAKTVWLRGENTPYN